MAFHYHRILESKLFEFTCASRLVGYLWVICQTETEVNPTFDCVLGLSRRFSKTHLKLSKALEDITKDSTGLADVNKSQESVALTTKPFKYLRFR